MDYFQLGKTNLRVSKLCLGTMTFGSQVDQSAVTRMLDVSIDAGINFIDAANIYTGGRSESMLGAAMRGRRDQFVLASKVGQKMGDGPDESGLSKRAIMRAAEASLKRLQTDWLDIYYLHAPDYATGIDETLEAMQTLVRDGKVRFTGTSNYASWQACQAHLVAERAGWQPPVIAQQMYNVLARGIEQEFVPMAKQFGIAISVYNPLAGGLLTGKHDPATIPPGGRFDQMRNYQDRYWHKQDFAAVRQLQQAAAAAGRSLISLSLGWLLHHSAADSVVLGASSVEQLIANIAASGEGPLPAAAVAACDAVWQDLRGPVPNYNR